MSAQFSISASLAEPAPAHDILGVQVRDLGRQAALLMLHEAIATRRHVKVAFCNAHTANLAYADDGFRRVLEGFVVMPDGVGVDIAARLLTGRRFAANLNGTDFIPALLTEAPAPLRVALIGGRPGIAAKAVEALAAQDRRHGFGPVLDGFADAPRIDDWLAELREKPADIILVAMGNPLQERFIASRLSGTHGTVVAGVGALFDFLAGETRRAPELVRRLRLEWVWRLMLEPQRLFRRYVLGNPLFLARVLAAKSGLSRR